MREFYLMVQSRPRSAAHSGNCVEEKPSVNINDTTSNVRSGELDPMFRESEICRQHVFAGLLLYRGRLRLDDALRNVGNYLQVNDHPSSTPRPTSQSQQRCLPDSPEALYIYPEEASPTRLWHQFQGS